MKIGDFLSKCKLKERDSKIVKKLYSDLEKTEKEWLVFLRNKISFKFEGNSKKRPVKVKKENQKNTAKNNKS